MSLALHYSMRGVHHCSGPSVSEMTYTVSSGTLNSTILYHTIPYHTVPLPYHIITGDVRPRLLLGVSALHDVPRHRPAAVRRRARQLDL